MSLHDLLQVAFAGLAVGSVYALVALGYTLIWNAASVVNFAQGDLVMIGAFVAVGSFADGLHVGVAAGLILTLIVMALLGAAMAWAIYHPLRHAPPLSAIVATLGLSMLLENLAVLLWGPRPRTFHGPLGNASVSIAGVHIYGQYILILAALLALVAAQEIMFRRTSIGRAMRATAQDAGAARLMGVRTSRMIAIIFAYAAVLAGIAGWLLAPLYYVSSEMGVNLSLRAFAAAILGGFGSIPGALIGGLLLGLIEVGGSFAVSSEYIDVISFGILFAVLVFRPQGMFGEIQLDRP